jgi:hypothetical protein
MGDIAWLRALDGAMVIFTGFRGNDHVAVSRQRTAGFEEI